MKNLLLLVFVFLSLTPCAQAQSLAYETPAALHMEYSPTAFSRYHSNSGETTTLTKVGTIMSGVGIVTGIVGAVTVISNISFVSREDNDKVTTGAIAFVVGGVIGITGGCLAIAGLIQRHHLRYGFVMPKNNQLGVAYNF